MKLCLKKKNCILLMFNQLIRQLHHFIVSWSRLPHVFSLRECRNQEGTTPSFLPCHSSCRLLSIYTYFLDPMSEHEADL